jgi:hypothetical protein
VPFVSRSHFEEGNPFSAKQKAVDFSGGVGKMLGRVKATYPTLVHA